MRKLYAGGSACFFITVLSVFLMSGTVNGQNISNYNFSTNNTGSLVDMSSGTTELPLAGSTGIFHDDNASLVTTLPFTFYFMSTGYDRFSVNSNGQLKLGNATNNTALNGTGYTGASSGNAIFAPITGDNALLATGKVHYKVTGAPGSYFFVLEWTGLRIPYSTSAGTGSTVQITFDEATGTIEYIYGTMYNNSTSATTRSVGLGSTNNSTSAAYIATITATPTFTPASSWSTSSFAASSDMANLGSASDGSRRVFTFTPLSNSAAADPTTLTFSNVAASTITANWVDNSTSETYFIVTRATDAAFTQNVSTTTVASTTRAATGGAYNIALTGLTINTTYYIKVQAANEASAASAGISGNQATLASGATYTWVATTGTASWAAPASWSPARNVPDGYDLLQFTNGGSSTATNIPTESVRRITISNNTTINLQAAVASTLTIISDGTAAEELSIAAGSTLMSNGSTAALGIAFSGTGGTGSIAGTLELTSASGTVANTISFTGGTFVFTVTGNLANGQSGGTGVPTMTGNTSALIMAAGATYTHKFATSSGTVPTATWDPASNCNIIGYTAASMVPGGMGQTFGNLTWNCTGQGTNNYNLSLSSTTFNVAGTFTMASTGTTGSLRLTGTGSYTANINNLTITGGTLDLQSGSSGSPSFNVSGTLNQSGGLFTSTATSTANPTVHFNGTVNQAVTFATQPTGPITYRISNPQGITLSAPFANFAIGNGTLGGLRVSTTAATPITFAGSLSAIQYNAANTTLTYDAAGNITATGIEFPSASGPASLAINVGALNTVTLPFSRTVRTTLTMTSGDIDISSNTLTLGTSAAAVGTLTYTAGNVRVTTGAMTRWFGTTGLPTAAGTGIGFFPLANGGNNRNVSIYFSTATALSTGGSITASHANAAGFTTVSFLDGAYTVEKRTNAGWTFSASGVVASGTIGVRLTGGGLLTTSTPANLRLVQAAGALKTHVAGSGTSPNFMAQRSAFTLADFTQTHYIGASNADASVVFNSIATGNWETASTWDQNAVPGASDLVNISAGNTVTAAGTAAASSLTIFSGGTLISSGTLTSTTILNSGTLNITGGTTTVNTSLSNSSALTVSAGSLIVTGAAGSGITNLSTGVFTVAGGTVTLGASGGSNRTFANTGTLTVSSGTLNINGNISHTGGAFNHSGGNINIDGNAAGVGANSVASGTYLMNLTTSVNWTGGTLTIVDPHTATTATSAYSIYFNSGSSSEAAATHTIRFGDGVSSDAGGHSLGFNVNNYVGSGKLFFGTVIVNAPGAGTAASTNRKLTTVTYTFGAKGNLTINNNAEFDMNSVGLIVGGNLTVDGILTASSTITLAMPSGTSSVVNSNSQAISGTGVFRNAATTPTAELTSLSINNNSVSGVTPAVPLSLSGTLTLTSGVVHTTSSTLLSLGTATAAGTLSGGSATAYINGPFTRTFAASRASTGFVSSALFPVGVGASYLPIHVDAVTSAGGPVVINSQAFTSNSGTMGAGVTSLSTNRWEALITSGGANFTGASVQITDASVVSTNKILQSISASGSYSGVPAATSFTTGVLGTTSAIPGASYSGYFAYGDLTACSTPGNQATVFVVSSKTNTSVTGSFTLAASAPSHYLVVRYASGATPTDPVDFTTYAVGQTVGAGGNLGTVVANVASPSNTFTATGLTASTAYDFYIYSYNNAACSGPAYRIAAPLIGAVTTCAAAVTSPTTPTSSAITSSGFTVNWTADPTVTFQLDIATNSGFTAFVAGYNSKALAAGTVSEVVTGLSASTNHYVRIRAIDAGCYSSYTSTLTVATLAVPMITGFTSSAACAATTLLTITGTGLSSATVTIGGSPVTTASNTATQITANITTSMSGTITVTNAGGTANSATPFSFVLAPPFTLSTGSVNVCAGSSSVTPVTVTAGGADYNVYTWSPLTNVSGNATTGWTFNPSASGTYTMTASQSSGSCVRTASVAVVVIEGVSVAPATATPATICQGSNSQLSVTPTTGYPQIKFTEITQFRTGTGATPTYPAYTSGPNDMVEISNLSSSAKLVGGLVFELWNGSALERSYTIPAGTTIPANGVLILGLGAGTTDAGNLFFNTGGTDDVLSSGEAAGYILKNGSVLVDVVATNSYVWPVSSGVTAEWSGNIASASTFAGVIRTAVTDNNVATDWTISSASTTQSIGSYNGGYTPVVQNLTYAWTPSTYLDNATIANPLATAVAATTAYSVTVTESINGCTASSNVTVTVDPATVPGTVAGPQSICTGTQPADLVLSGNTGNVVRWESASDAAFTTPATIASTATTLTGATIGNLTASTYFRAVVKSGVCNEANTAGVLVTVSPTTVAGTVAGDQTICSGTQPADLVLSGNTGSVVKWQKSADAAFTTPTDITSTATTLTGAVIGNLSAATYFRALVQSGGCAIENTAAVLVSVNAATVAGTVTGDQAICSGSQPADLVLAGNTGSVLKWQSASDAAFTSPTDIASTSTTLTGASIGALSASTYYRAVVKSGVCPSANTAAILVTVSPTTVAGTVTAAQTICTGTQPADLVLGGNTGVVVKWQKSSDAAFTTPTDIASTATTLTGAVIGSLSSDTYFRAVVQSGACAPANTAAVLISIDAASVGGTVAGAQTVCSGSQPSTDLVLSGNTGNVVKWQKSTDAAFTSPTDISSTSATLTGAVIGNLSVSTYFRAVVKNGACTEANSASVLITVNTSGGGTLAGDQTICSGTQPATDLVLTGNSGAVLKWQKSTDAGFTSPVDIASTATTLTGAAIGNLTVSTYFRAVVQSGSCASVNSNSVLVTVTPLAVGGTVAGTQSVCTGSAPSTDLVLSGNVGTVVKWQKSTDAAFTSPVDIASTATTLTGATIGNLSQDTYFRAVVQSGSCGTANSASVLVSVDAATVAGSVSGTQTICSGTQPGTDLVLSGNNGTAVKWQKSTDAAFTSPVDIASTATTLTGATIGTLSQSTYFRAVVQNGSCASANSAAVLVTVEAATVAGSVSGTQTVCIGNAPSTSLVLSGNTGTVVKWQKSTDAAFTSPVDIASTATTLTGATIGTLTQTTWFRAVVQSGGCGAANSASVTITVNSTIDNTTSLAGTAGGAQVCASYDVAASNDYLNNCNAIASIVPGGASPVSGNISVCLQIDGTVQTASTSEPYVQRHYNVTPAVNPATATATMTLYFLQSEFDAFNTARGTYAPLPTNGSDATGKANLRITQFNGAGTTPGTYPAGSGSQINPSDASIVYNATANRWEVSFSVTGSGGFYVHTGNFVLPVALTKFKGEQAGNMHKLSWTTATETNNKGFELQRSADGTNFSSLAYVGSKAPGGNSNNSIDYGYNDVNPLAGNNYYRLKQLDKDGNFSYSNVILLTRNIPAISISRLYPNPAMSQLNLEVISPRLEKVTILVSDLTGKVAMQQKTELSAGNNLPQLNVQALAAGNYTIRIVCANGCETTALRFVKQ